jgi:hypothetical protein
VRLSFFFTIVGSNKLLYALFTLLNRITQGDALCSQLFYTSVKRTIREVLESQEGMGMYCVINNLGISPKVKYLGIIVTVIVPSAF